MSGYTPIIDIDMDGDPFEIYDRAVSKEIEDAAWQEYCAKFNDAWRKSVDDAAAERTANNNEEDESKND